MSLSRITTEQNGRCHLMSQESCLRTSLANLRRVLHNSCLSDLKVGDPLNDACRALSKLGAITESEQAQLTHQHKLN